MPKIARVGLLVLITGLLATIVYSRRNERALWIPASADLPISQGQSTEVGFTATEDGFCELEIAADDNIERDGRRLIMATGEESSLDIDWEVRLDGETIASGDSRAYLYVQGGPPSLTGRLRRIGMRDPFGQNEKCWRSFGLLGATTISRGIGRFSVRAGQRYTVSASAADDSTRSGPPPPSFSFGSSADGGRRITRRHERLVIWAWGPRPSARPCDARFDSKAAHLSLPRALPQCVETIVES